MNSSLYFSRNTADGGVLDFDIFFASRADLSEPFGSASKVPGDVNTTSSEARPSVTGDLLNLYYTSFPGDGGGAAAVHFATRPTTQAAWTAQGPIAALNGASGGSTPYVLPDHGVIYFVSARSSGNADLYRASRIGGTWGTPDLVPGTNINTPAGEDSPVVTPDELTLYFGSGRGSDGGASGLTYVARRSSAAVPFDDAPVPVVELNTPVPQGPTWVSADGCVLYVSQAGEIKVATRGK